MVLWFYGLVVCSFMVLWFYGLIVLWFLGLKVYQIAISCFEEDIDPICKIFENLLDGSSGFVGARLFTKK